MRRIPQVTKNLNRKYPESQACPGSILEVWQTLVLTRVFPQKRKKKLGDFWNQFYENFSNSNRPRNLESSTDKINRELSNLQMRTEARKNRPRKSQSVEKEKSPPKENLERRNSSKAAARATNSFGMNAAPAMRNSETQTEKASHTRRRIPSRYYSMHDVRAGITEEDSFSESQTGKF